jgi:DNA repair protein RecO (recombination protein O)
MSHESSKALVLRSLFFKDNQKILTLFSESFGLISLVMKGCSAPFKGSLSQPFCEAEFFFTKGSSDLRKYQDGSIIDLHLPLRNKLSYLKTASSMIKAVLTSQLPEKHSPHLYALISSFLKQVPLFSFQETLLACFYLKFLRHEGLYHKDCTLPSISLEEQQILAKLAYLQSFDELKKEEIPPFLFTYVETFFFDQIKN